MNNRNDSELRLTANRIYAAALVGDSAKSRRTQFVYAIKTLDGINKLNDEDYDLLSKCYSKYSVEAEEISSDEAELNLKKRDHNDVCSVLDRAINKTKDDRNRLIIADCYDHIGRSINDYELSLFFHQKAYDICSEIMTDASYKNLADISHNIYVTHEMGDPINTRELQIEALKQSIYYYSLLPATPDICLDMASSLNSLRKCDNESAEECIDAIINLINAIPESQRDDECHRLLGNVFLLKGDLLMNPLKSSEKYDAAIIEFNKIKALSNQDYRVLATIYHNLACDYKSVHAPVSVEVYIRKAMETLEKVYPQIEKDRIEKKAYLKFLAEAKVDVDAAKAAIMEVKPKSAASVIPLYSNHSSMYGKPSVVANYHDEVNKDMTRRLARF